MRFQHNDAAALPMQLLGLGPRWSYIEVDATHLRVTMAWGFRMRVPLTSIRSVEKLDRPIPWKFGIGVHWWFGEWAVNAARSPHVMISFGEPHRAYTVGVPIRVRVLHLSPRDPDAFLPALAEARSGGSLTARP